MQLFELQLHLFAGTTVASRREDGEGEEEPAEPGAEALVLLSREARGRETNVPPARVLIRSVWLGK